MPREPDVFGQPTRAYVVQHVVDDGGNVAHLAEIHARHRIEIDTELIGMI